MCFVFTCGEHTFRKQVEGYESITCQCHNCGNYAGHVIKSNPWFTFCFIVRLFPWFLFLIYKRVASAPFVKELPARIDQQANFPFPRHLARPPALLQGLPGRHLQRLQLRPAPREQARRAKHARRGRPGPVTKSAVSATASGRSATGLGRRRATTTTAAAGYAVWLRLMD